jgi:type I restriction enzyme R subunit
MTTHTYTEDQLVEQPAIGLFAELGWSENHLTNHLTYT